MAERTPQDSAAVRVPPPLIFITGLLVGALVERWAPTPNPPGVWALVAAVVGVALAVVLGGAAIRRFAQHHTAAEPWKPSSALVTTGPYRYTRNPMYLGMAGLYLGIALTFGWLWSLALLPVVLIVIDRAVIAREERYLTRRFGESYLAYQEQVRRWL